MRSLDDNHRVIFNRSANELELPEYGVITFSPGATGGQRTARATLDASGNLSVSGDVLLTGADYAEDFDVSGACSLEPGTVVVIDDDGALRESHFEPSQDDAPGRTSRRLQFHEYLLEEQGPGRAFLAQRDPG